MSNTYYLATDDWLNISFRLCIALVVGAIIGLDREIKRKPAGLRTHMLVSFGSAIFILTIMQTGGLQTSPDEISRVIERDAISRVIQGIATGIGFLGAGEIVRQSSQESQRLEIHGLTSAAAIWVSAALGIAAGCGLWQLGLIASLLTFVVLNVFKRLE
ncbi:MgtC/SapB family protein [Nostoc edaphicum CCNP1411]|uniref:MgtC/SapB family protein n=1 Tax=Nostoc edaphicum CCNP1411 TaxID=1472755 RepID=A0A7D7QR47_9NOSO|nr:MgtC/SapB family protein [Nostoc edaphicum]QMS91805.1 MgtC/SapB family protein [Nostoc edaphicum CCNP1411]